MEPLTNPLTANLFPPNDQKNNDYSESIDSEKIIKKEEFSTESIKILNYDLKTNNEESVILKQNPESTKEINILLENPENQQNGYESFNPLNTNNTNLLFSYPMIKKEERRNYLLTAFFEYIRNYYEKSEKINTNTTDKEFLQMSENFIKQITDEGEGIKKFASFPLESLKIGNSYTNNANFLIKSAGIKGMNVLNSSGVIYDEEFFRGRSRNRLNQNFIETATKNAKELQNEQKNLKEENIFKFIQNNNFNETTSKKELDSISSLSRKRNGSIEVKHHKNKGGRTITTNMLRVKKLLGLYLWETLGKISGKQKKDSFMPSEEQYMMAMISSEDIPEVEFFVQIGEIARYLDSKPELKINMLTMPILKIGSSLNEILTNKMMTYPVSVKSWKYWMKLTAAFKSARTIAGKTGGVELANEIEEAVNNFKRIAFSPENEGIALFNIMHNGEVSDNKSNIQAINKKE